MNQALGNGNRERRLRSVVETSHSGGAMGLLFCPWNNKPDLYPSRSDKEVIGVWLSGLLQVKIERDENYVPQSILEYYRRY